MSIQDRRSGMARASLVIVLLASSICLSILPSVAASSLSPASSGPLALPSKAPALSAPPGAFGPDDITMLAVAGVDGGRAMIWVAFQNGINADGTPGTPGGPIQSTVAGYDPSSGSLILTVQVLGKVDGLTADPAMGALIATVNEDANSRFNLIYPAIGAVATYAYSPSPEVNGNGGTDSIAVLGNQIYVSHSNPNDTTQPTDYRVMLDTSTPVYTAKLTPVFYDDSKATNALTGARVQMALTDPDTNYIMPLESPRFAGQLATISQADGELVFATSLMQNPKIEVVPLTDNVLGNKPPIDGLAVATANRGTLYVVDNGANSIIALDTAGWRAGTVFVGEPNDNSNPLIGVLNLSNGVITPLSNSFQDPKGILFVTPHDLG
jgi:hypothetical protein